jgi:hypothetical protein
MCGGRETTIEGTTRKLTLRRAGVNRAFPYAVSAFAQAALFAAQSTP